MRRIILASGSPRRLELMRRITPDFTVHVSDVEELVPEGMTPENQPAYLAMLKARAVAETEGADALVIGCDTSVFIDGEVLGKPHSEEEARKTLRSLSGRAHAVITGCCLLYQGECRVFSERTEVKFFELTDAEIDAYVATGEPMDKAGAYGIQGAGGLLVSGIIGDYYNVMGFPMARIAREMRDVLGEI